MVDKFRTDVEELKKLPPEERIKRLKEIEKQKEREKKELSDLMKKAEVEAKEEEVENDVEFQREMVEESEALENITFDAPSDLETSVQGGPVGQQALQNVPSGFYESELRFQPMQNIYDAANEIRERAEDEGVVSPEMASQAYQIGTAVYQKQEDIDDGSYTTSDRVKKQVDKTQSLIDEVMGKYKT